MSFLRQVDRGDSFPPFAALREYFGFVPAVFRCQTLLPRLIEAEAHLLTSILLPSGTLSQKQKERLLLAVAAANGNGYLATNHYQILSVLGEREDRLDLFMHDLRHAGLPSADVALLEFAVELATQDPSGMRQNSILVHSQGWSGEALADAVRIAAWANFLSTLSTGLGPAPDFAPVPLPSPGAVAAPDRAAQRSGSSMGTPGFLLPHGRPAAVQAESEFYRVLMLAEEALNRRQKERLLLALSAEGRPVAVEEHESALWDFARKLAFAPARFAAPDLEPLRARDFTDEQLLETIVTTAFARYVTTVRRGLGMIPDSAAAIIRSTKPESTQLPSVPPKVANLLTEPARPIAERPGADPDAEIVGRVQQGDCDAFEELIHRHSRRVYRTLIGILGNPEEARDAMQDTFLKAFQHLAHFQGRSRFSTWLVSIAGNTGLQLLRERKPLQPLDDDRFEEEGYRPQQIRAWSDDPEQVCSKAEMRAMVEGHVMKLPAKYRVVLILRDLEQLSIDEAAAALGLGIPALKSRHLRARLMLRESLAPHFTASAKGGSA